MATSGTATALTLTLPEIVVPALPHRPTMVETVRHALARSVAQIIDRDHGTRVGDDPEDVHQLRVATRRLRSDLRSFRTLLRDDVGWLRDEIRWVGSEVGAVRDVDVLRARFAVGVASLPGVDAAGGKLLMRRLETQARAARKRMLTAMQSTRYVALLDELGPLAASPPWRDEQELATMSAEKIARRLVRKQWKRLRGAVAALPSTPSDAELHRVRILAKRCRYAAEAVAPVAGKKAVRFAEAVEDVQTVLGDHQDTVVAEAWLRSASAAAPQCALAAGQLVARERRERQRLRETWPDTWKHANEKKIRHWLT